MLLNEKLVSIIIPVFNVEEYIDECLNSVINQTYRNIEVIIIYSKSDDDSLEKCQFWSENDYRIRVVVIGENICLGKKRNIGIEYSQGDYITFVDSDDWIESDFVECLVNAIEEAGADIAGYTGAFFVEKDRKKRVCWIPSGTYVTKEDLGFLMTFDSPAVWKRIYKKSWVKKNKLYFPTVHHYEDWAYNIYSILSANKVTLIKGLKYNYRIRTDSLSSESTVLDYNETLAFGISECRRLDVYDGNEVFIMLNVLAHLQMHANMHKEREIPDEALKTIWKNFDNDFCPVENEVDYILIGSFSSWWSLMSIGISRDIEHYNFSSLISAMTVGKEVVLNNLPEYRIKQIMMDTSGQLYKRISDITRRTVLYIDFLNERFDIIKDGENYYTDSEALKEGKFFCYNSSEVIKNRSCNYMRLWADKCDTFLDLLNRIKNKISVVLIKERLSEYYGGLDDKKRFSNIDDIRETNKRIDSLENIFLGKCQDYGIEVKQLGFKKNNDRIIFTDLDFKYGCDPQYLNNYAYGYLGRQIFLDRLERINSR